ncbi:hypothetical protein D3C85_1182760 [compost metagenome]
MCPGRCTGIGQSDVVGGGFVQHQATGNTSATGQECQRTKNSNRQHAFIQWHEILLFRSLNRYRLDRPKAEAPSFTRAAFLSVCAELQPQVQLIAGLKNRSKNRRAALRPACCCVHFTTIIRKAPCIFGQCVRYRGGMGIVESTLDGSYPSPSLQCCGDVFVHVLNAREKAFGSWY